MVHIDMFSSFCVSQLFNKYVYDASILFNTISFRLEIEYFS